MFTMIRLLSAGASVVSEAPSTQENLFSSLIVMAKGMLGIFIALTVIYLFVLLLTKLFPKDRQSKEEN